MFSPVSSSITFFFKNSLPIPPKTAVALLLPVVFIFEVMSEFEPIDDFMVPVISPPKSIAVMLQ